jgi:Amt family ammonium transporter
MIAITPACGYIPVYFAPVVGIVAAVICNFATKIKFWMNVDDGLDVFALHAVGGLAGSIMTGLFAADYIAALDGVSVISGGWIQGNWVQLGYQLAGSVAYVPLIFEADY